MVWVREKKTVHHVLDMGFERVEIPVRVKFQFEVKQGLYVADSLSKETLYNQKAVAKHLPMVSPSWLETEIEKTVDKKIMDYLGQCGFLPDSSNDPA